MWDSSPEDDDGEGFCWPEGGWPQVEHMPAPTSIFPKALESDVFFTEELQDLPEMPIGEAEALFFNSQEELFLHEGESTHDKSSEDSGEDAFEDSGEDDYIDEDYDWSLEEMLRAPELFHSVHSLRATKRCRRR
jgi:hypothetical protein